MKSGKSLELIARVAPYEFADQQVLYVQPKANVRDEGITSRLGINTRAMNLKTLKGVKTRFDVIGIDEVHMFSVKDMELVEKWLKQGKALFISGLDLDYRGKMPPVIKKLIEMKPEKMITKLAVCDTCKKYEARFTQIIHKNKPVLAGLPIIVPDDGTYKYIASCRSCFVKA
jgi:thymidine kinase